MYLVSDRCSYRGKGTETHTHQGNMAKTALLSLPNTVPVAVHDMRTTRFDAERDGLGDDRSEIPEQSVA